MSRLIPPGDLGVRGKRTKRPLSSVSIRRDTEENGTDAPEPGFAVLSIAYLVTWESCAHISTSVMPQVISVLSTPKVFERSETVRDTWGHGQL